MSKNKLQDYKFIFSDKVGFVLKENSRIIRIKSYKNRVSATRDAEKTLKRLNKYSVKIFEIKGKVETEIKEIKIGE